MARKDITDLMVCQAVAAYRSALGECPTILRLGSWRGRILMPSGPPRPAFPHVALAAQTGEPEKVCFRAMERAEARGLIECGVSLRTAWLTDAGEALLAQVDPA